MVYLDDVLLDFDRHEMTIYEEVAKMPPFHRKTLVLVGKDISVKEYRFLLILKELLLRKSIRYNLEDFVVKKTTVL